MILVVLRSLGQLVVLDYLKDKMGNTIHAITENFRQELHYLCLGQDLGRDAAAGVFHTADLSKAVIGGVLGVHQFVHIGKMAMLGGMSRIDRDVPPFTLVEGNPCRVRTLNLVGLQRAGFTDEDLALLKKAFRIIYRSNINLQEALEQVSLLTDFNLRRAYGGKVSFYDAMTLPDHPRSSLDYFDRLSKN